jgi:hypothetical protein
MLFEGNIVIILCHIKWINLVLIIGSSFIKTMRVVFILTLFSSLCLYLEAKSGDCVLLESGEFFNQGSMPDKPSGQKIKFDGPCQNHCATLCPHELDFCTEAVCTARECLEPRYNNICTNQSGITIGNLMLEMIETSCLSVLYNWKISPLPYIIPKCKVFNTSQNSIPGIFINYGLQSAPLGFSIKRVFNLKTVLATRVNIKFRFSEAIDSKPFELCDVIVSLNGTDGEVTTIKRDCRESFGNTNLYKCEPYCFGSLNFDVIAQHPVKSIEIFVNQTTMFWGADFAIYNLTITT